MIYGWDWIAVGYRCQWNIRSPESHHLAVETMIYGVLLEGEREKERRRGLSVSERVALQSETKWRQKRKTRTSNGRTAGHIKPYSPRPRPSPLRSLFLSVFRWPFLMLMFWGPRWLFSTEYVWGHFVLTSYKFERTFMLLRTSFVYSKLYEGFLFVQPHAKKFVGSISEF